MLDFLEQIPKLLDGKAGIPNDAAQCVPVYGIVPRDRKNAAAVGHQDALALPHDLEASPLERSYRPMVGNSRNFRHRARPGLRLPAAGLARPVLWQHPDTRESRRECWRKSGAGDAKSFFGWCQGNGVLHSFFTLTSVQDHKL